MKTAQIIPLRPSHERRHQMAFAMTAADRCLAAAATETDCSATKAALARAALRYLERFDNIAAGRAA